MPCSPDNLYPCLEGKGVQKRWELIERTLLQDWNSSEDFEERLFVYNHHYKVSGVACSCKVMVVVYVVMSLLLFCFVFQKLLILTL